MVKNKEQVRHFYYRTWHKISKHIDFANGEFPFFTLVTANNWPDIFTTNPNKTETEVRECWFKLFSVKCNWMYSYSLRTNIWLLVIWTSNRTRKVCFNCAIVKKQVVILRLRSSSILICWNISAYVIISRLLCPSRCFCRGVCLTNVVAKPKLWESPLPSPPCSVTPVARYLCLACVRPRRCHVVTCSLPPSLPSVLQGAKEVLAGTVRPHLLRRAPQKSRRM